MITQELGVGLLSIVITDECSYSEFAHHLETALRSAPANTNLLIDLRDTRWVPTSDDLRRIAAVIASRAPVVAGRAAMVVTSELHYGLGRMLGIYLEGFAVHFDVFRQRERALQYLKGPDPGDMLTAAR